MVAREGKGWRERKTAAAAARVIKVGLTTVEIRVWTGLGLAFWEARAVRVWVLEGDGFRKRESWGLNEEGRGREESAER